MLISLRIVRDVLLAALFVVAGTSAVEAADAIPTGTVGTLALGANWGSYETYQGKSFRWVANDAQIILQPGSGEARLNIVCAGGPSLGQPVFPLRVLDAQRRQVDHVMCAGPGQPVSLLLPLGAAATRYTLHVDGGGRRVRGDPRTLNVQVFSLDDPRSGPTIPDVADARSGIRFGNHWHGVERYQGESFRWMDGSGGQIIILSDHPARTTLHIDLAPGPSIGGTGRTTLSVRRSDGTAIVRTPLAGRRTITVPVTLRPGETMLTLDVTTANRAVPHDPRILNLRVFRVAMP